MIRFLNVYFPVRTVFLLLCEAFIVGGCFALSAWIVLGQDTWLVLNYEFGGLKLLGVTAMSLIFSYYFDLYEPQLISGREEIYFRILLVLGFDCFAVWLLLMVFPDAQMFGQGRVYVLGIAMLTPVLIVWRRIYEWMLGRPIFREQVYVLGGGPQATAIVETIRSRQDLGMEVVQWAGPTTEAEPARKSLWTAELQALESNISLSRIIIALENERGELPVQELLNFRFRGVVVEDSLAIVERLTGRLPLDGLRPSTFLYSEGFRLRRSMQVARQFISVVAAATGLLVFAPFFPLVALAVKLSSPGPLFFRQTRVGLRGAHFKVVKFRTMRTDAEAAGAKWAVKNDPRVTRIGMLLRKTRLDEVPQLWNVLKGDMGFVGPRPERPEFTPMLAEKLPFYELRHLIRPGLTGWAQIRYGYGATLEQAGVKLEYDLYYLKHMTLGLDLFIMFETIKTIVRRRGSQ